MPTYKAPVSDTVFLLSDVFNYANYANAPGFSEAPIDVVEAVLSEGAKFVEEVVQPLNRVGDIEGCKRHDDGSVATPKGFKQAYKALVEGGWVGLAGDPAFGGQGLPPFLAVLFSEYTYAANLAFAMYPSLTNGAVKALMVHANDDLKSRYLPKMTTGEWTGTMCLTEAHCGTDLGLIRTRAVPLSDGSHAITGEKIFVSAGEHDLADNIVHLVLARIDGAPAGVKGISLFLVPKYLPDQNGAVGERNGVVCGSIEHKMGIHGNTTAVLNFDAAKAWLVGEEHRGLPAMFVMMNGARLGVGVQGLAISEVAYQNAAAYAKERRQGRSLKGAVEPDKPADLLLVHPDVRRMLLEVRAFTEAARAFLVWIALTQDEARHAPEEKARQAADDRLGLMTPVMKGVFTDTGFANAVRAQQVLGGHGYIAEWGMEQFVRDARISMMYEGANGVQALDLVARKLPKDGGRALMAFLRRSLAVPGSVEGRRGSRALFGRPQDRARPLATGEPLAAEERARRSQQRGRGVDRLHASVRFDGARLHVGADRQGGLGSASEVGEQPRA